MAAQAAKTKAEATTAVQQELPGAVDLPVTGKRAVTVARSLSKHKEQRDPATGMFLPGHKPLGGPGRGAAWVAILREEATPERVKNIVKKAVETAEKHEDWRARADARDWIFRYLSPIAHTQALAHERELKNQTFEQRVLRLLETCVTNAEEMGTPDAAADALKSLEAAAGVMRATRGNGVLPRSADTYDTSNLTDEEMELLRGLLSRARVVKEAAAVTTEG